MWHVEQGLRHVWVLGGLPLGGDCHLFDDHGEMVWLLDRDSFVEDPDGFMDSMERHGDQNVRGYGWHLSLAAGAGRSPVPSRQARAGRALAAVMALPMTGCAAVAAQFIEMSRPVTGV